MLDLLSLQCLISSLVIPLSKWYASPQAANFLSEQHIMMLCSTLSVCSSGPSICNNQGAFQSALYALKHRSSELLIPHSTRTVEARVSSTMFAYRINSFQALSDVDFVEAAHTLSNSRLNFWSTSFMLFYVLRLLSSHQFRMSWPYLLLLSSCLCSHLARSIPSTPISRQVNSGAVLSVKYYHKSVATLIF